ncbi:unnamed protein product [Linum tenue]|uniref:C2H2-type domain-containing protein n=1 Tax=Linum tenue TaxID=586396 RepID=A0AAV0LRJ1_9ROSI|nr:unnamed protein product [Linum tenue]
MIVGESMAEVENSSQITVSGEANSPCSLGDLASPPPPPSTTKKKRNLPGMPDPEAEVIALSPKALMATNRFVCEICNKGFQRDQNLQLHRRGHNLPWKLKQRGTKEPRKRVYVCPEPTCVHHDPTRALGDLTGIKKHFSRKHGEKKWKCERCSKKYAVQSDWKAHMKTCGTREYKCDCGTLFSRRDSFITHRAFCDALAEETIRTTTNVQTVKNNLPANGDEKTAAAAVLAVRVASPPPPPLTPSTTVVSPGNSIQSSELAENPVILPSPAAATTTTTVASAASASTSSTCTTSTSNVFASIFTTTTTSTAAAAAGSSSFTNLLQTFTPAEFPATMPAIIEPPPSLSLSPPPLYFASPSAGGGGGGGVQDYSHRSGHHYGQATMSATALLQKAAQMGATTSNQSFLRGLGLQMSAPAPAPAPFHSEDRNIGNHHQWDSKQESGSGLQLGLSQSFGPTTLDLLGLGLDSSSALLTSYSNGFDYAAAAAAASSAGSYGGGGGGRSSEETWDNSTGGGAERKANGSAASL